MNPRYERGIQMAATRRVVKGGRVDDHYQYAYVQSQTNPKQWYKVKEDGTCECADHFYRNVVCKHVYCIVVKEVGYEQ